MTTISENLQIIKNSTLAMKQAIIDKGGIINGDITTWANSIANIPSGGSGGSLSVKGDVTFYDYDGTVLHSFSKDEFLALNELPSLPTQPGLTCQGWNYDITKAKTYVEKYGKLDIGATYITDNSKTRLYIRIAAEGRITVPLYFSQTKSNGVTIDWGDGSATQTLSGTGNKNTSHTYDNIGDYCITLTATSGCTLGLGHNASGYCVMGSTGNNGKVYCNMLRKVEIGTGVTNIRNDAFYSCYSLASVVIPNSVTSIGSEAFSSCYGMAFYDFSNHTSIPTLSNTNAFKNIPSDCKIIVPDNLYDTWITATNWSKYASYIIKKSDWDAL